MVFPKTHQACSCYFASCLTVAALAATGQFTRGWLLNPSGAFPRQKSGKPLRRCIRSCCRGTTWSASSLVPAGKERPTTRRQEAQQQSQAKGDSQASGKSSGPSLPCSSLISARCHRRSLPETTEADVPWDIQPTPLLKAIVNGDSRHRMFRPILFSKKGTFRWCCRPSNSVSKEPFLFLCPSCRSLLFNGQRSPTVNRWENARPTDRRRLFPAQPRRFSKA